MLYTYVHHKEYSDADWDVAHLYEHLITRAFQSYLQSIGIHPGFIGHVSGDTFKHIIFLNAIFYDKKVAETYEHFLATPELIDQSFVPRALLEIETEEKITLIMQDEIKFNTQLHSLIAQPWSNNSLTSSKVIDESKTAEAVFQVKQTAKKFRDAVVGVYANTSDLSNDERTLFLRLSAIVGDAIDFAIRSNLQGIYYFSSSPIAKDDEVMGNVHHIRFRRGDSSLKLIKKTAEEALHGIDVESAMPLITAQFQEFADRATWKSFAIDYYRHTGILTNTEHISSLATPERIASVLSKLKIHVRVLQKGDDVWFS